jgi:hypothetical protein
MRWLVFAILLRAAVAHACGWREDDLCEGPYHVWSWTPLVSGQVAYGDERTQALVAGELRVRHGNYVSPNVTTASLRVASASFGTLEPAVILGYDFIQERRAYGPGYMAARDLRIALGGWPVVRG